MIKFILNDKEVSAVQLPGMLLLDYIRYTRNLTGTKIGCREGDCGACTVLVGELKNNEVNYRSFTSCLTPLGNIHGRHVVTIEGVNMSGLNPVQQAMADCSATQCGFCTPGIVMSLSGFCLSKKEPTTKNAIAAIDGNICRCTGYKSIERASEQVATLLQSKGQQDTLQFVADHQILPLYFKNIRERLTALNLQLNGALKQENNLAAFVGGGTDLYVQKPEDMAHADLHFINAGSEFKTIRKEGNKCIIGPSVTVTDLQESDLFMSHFPHFERQVKLVSSTPIRNMATIAGNFINASPIGDFTIFFLALDAVVIFSDSKVQRQVRLRELYKGYKTLDKKQDEFIIEISFELPKKGELFNFEKVSKRTNLDIASVNSAIQISVEADVIVKAGISAGGVGPMPMYLAKTSAWLKGKLLTEQIVREAAAMVQTEISPISDARGTAEYKSFLLGQLVKAHFLTLFPELKVEKIVAIG